MIKYSLICKQQHAFEGWFSNSEDFDDQKKRGLVTCPFCDTPSIEKSLMAPAVSTKKSSVPVETNETEAVTNAPVTKEYSDAIDKIREIRDQVQANSENVGNNFPEEARKIHYGESEERGIYGEATGKEVKQLVEEGVAVAPLPASEKKTEKAGKPKLSPPTEKKLN